MLPEKSFSLLAIGFALLLAIPVWKGDLPGYDDALYAHIAKSVYLSGDWFHLQSNGYPALEHPPLLPWLEAIFFHVFGLSDAVARLPSALSGFGIIVLVHWLAGRLFNHSKAALLAMFVMGTSVYFLKYAAHAMTDVPFAFFFLCAICAWKQSECNPKWMLLAGFFAAVAQMTRGMAGQILPIIFLLDLLLAKKRPNWLYLTTSLGIAFAPSSLWEWHLYRTYGDFYLTVHRNFLARDIGSPSLLRPFVFAGMLAKSYWPWLPAMLCGLDSTRNRLLLIWIGAVFAACSVVKNPVLRYLLPAYPAFAIAAGAALSHFTPEWAIRRCAPALAFGMAIVAFFLPTHWQALETRPMAIAATRATAPGERVGFYDAGVSRFDESNQLQWYGDRSLYILERRTELDRNVAVHRSRVFVIDRATRDAVMPASKILAEAGHLVCVDYSERQ